MIGVAALHSKAWSAVQESGLEFARVCSPSSTSVKVSTHSIYTTYNTYVLYKKAFLQARVCVYIHNILVGVCISSAMLANLSLLRH